MEESNLIWVYITQKHWENDLCGLFPLLRCLGNVDIISWGNMKDKPNEYWHDKRVIFHTDFTPARFGIWRHCYVRIAKHSAQFWWMPSSDNQWICPYVFDLPHAFMVPNALYRCISDISNLFIWEPPLNFDPFLQDVVMVPCRFYEQKFESIPYKEKTYDFLAFVDGDEKSDLNSVKIFEIVRELSKKYKCALIVLRDDLVEKGKNMGINVIKNTMRDRAGENKFRELIRKSKIYLDLQNRWTGGRNVYESLFHGAVSICSHTHGTAYLLFPDLVFNTYNFNMKKLYKLCVETVEKWTPELVENYRIRARKECGSEAFAKELKEVSERLWKKKI